MNGDTVIVRDFEGKALVRRVWDSSRDKVYICSEETYQLLLGGDTERWAVGFPRKDVFFYNVNALARLKGDSRAAWKQMKVWKESGEKKTGSPM